ncbi:hypothetical protein HPB52_004965 [Rhipicephalus sanguineus]|uniref:Uncharacterized protein n=1 Tax=Rhipicephalus sanguineus TaxID=34632 RepID=A0A9D4PLF8_RHISA|nr:hypothetical protein HPB52_004965 [Rhipicephalus sanguineus]
MKLRTLASISLRLSRCDSPVHSMSPQKRRIEPNTAAAAAAEYARVAAASSRRSLSPRKLSAWASWVPATAAVASFVSEARNTVFTGFHKFRRHEACLPEAAGHCVCLHVSPGAVPRRPRGSASAEARLPARTLFDISDGG